MAILAEEYTGLITNIITTQLTMPSRQLCQEKNWNVGLWNRDEKQMTRLAHRKEHIH